ncbi:sugar ABC transporter ATP-binding protein [Pelagicoccus mobilis]|uniref:Sugar ABC transporter ATP-binding protein n=2 Tax=Pelagicoccus mobilis TaxID=415221 RepID=A0A934RRI0_9BACT|nr:sugar ABC transporter ATP-binding protein [Pelagicoccus mobilis]
MGSNGAGKSTLAKILCGLTPRNSGDIVFNNVPHSPVSKQDASSAGIVIVMQELNIIPTLSIAQNLYFHDLPTTRFGIIDRARLHSDAQEALARVKLGHLNPNLTAETLGVGQQQLLEIAAALTQDCKLLILDEPTAALTDPEIETLFEQIKQLTAQGVAILYVSHRMEEIRRISDRVTVMRDGRRISTYDTKDVDQKTLVREMAGKEIWSTSHTPSDLSEAPVTLEVRKLANPPLVQDLSLKLRKGEILGIAGLVGSGRTECLQTIFGATPADSGEILVNGSSVSIKHPSDAVRLGIGMIPEDRKSEGLLLSQSIRANATLASHDTFSSLGLIDQTKETLETQSACGGFSVKHDHSEQAVQELSGGNQQKIVLIRWILRDSEILLLDEPTRGVDVAAKESIYTSLRELAAKGKSILIVSSELLELMTLCDRILAFSGGQVVQEFTPDNWSQEAITEAAFKAYLEPTIDKAPNK